MAIEVKRHKREIRDIGIISFEIKANDVGKTYDFMGILDGFRILDVNVTVDEAFDNADNTIEVGIEDNTQRFIPSTAINAIKGIPFNNKQFTASNTTSIIVAIKGSDSSKGKAIVTVEYAKLASCKQDY